MSVYRVQVWRDVPYHHPICQRDCAYYIPNSMKHVRYLQVDVHSASLKHHVLHVRLLHGQHPARVRAAFEFRDNGKRIRHEVQVVSTKTGGARCAHRGLNKTSWQGSSAYGKGASGTSAGTSDRSSTMHCPSTRTECRRHFSPSWCTSLLGYGQRHSAAGSS